MHCEQRDNKKYLTLVGQSPPSRMRIHWVCPVIDLGFEFMLISIILLLLLLLKFSLHAKMKNCFSRVPAHHNLV